MSEGEDSQCLVECGSPKGAAAADLVVGTSRPWVDRSRQPSVVAVECSETRATLELVLDNT